MLRLPSEFQLVISTFSFAFRSRVWQKANLLLIGAICCPGSRTVTNLLRSLGRSQDKCFHKFHRFLSKDKWSGLKLSQILLLLLVDAFVDEMSALVFGLDETIERRWGPMIKKRGIYRDAVRSSAAHFVKCSGLRWMCLMLLTPLPWTGGASWALPILTALCPSERFWKKRDQPRTHKPLMSWAGQMLCWLARYAKPLGRPVFLVGDGTYATYELLIKAASCQVGLIVRMRMDARLFHFPPPRIEGKRGPDPTIGSRILAMNKRQSDKRVKWIEVVFDEWYGKTQKKMLITSGQAIWSRHTGESVPVKWVLVVDPEGKLNPTLLSCTDLDTEAIDIVRYFVRRWRVEVTFAEVRRHLGVETQRQWSDLAIERSTPLLMGLKSVVCLFALPLFESGKINIQATAWYAKKAYTFSDILSAVRQQIWACSKFSTSPLSSEVESLEARIRYLEDLLAQAAA